MTLISSDCKDYTLALKLSVDYLAEDISIELERYDKKKKKMESFSYPGNDLSSALKKYKELNSSGDMLVRVKLPTKKAV